MRLDEIDREALRYRSFCADRILTALKPQPGERFLDVGAGTGVLSIGAAQAVSPGGRVIAVDPFAPDLERLEDKIRQFGISNIDVHEMDGSHLDFRRDYFDMVASLFGLLRQPDPATAIREWQRVLRPGGRFCCAVPSRQAFQPYVGLLQRQLQQHGIDMPVPWQRLGDGNVLRALLDQQGLRNIDIQTLPIAYHLTRAEDWWDIARYGELAGSLSVLSDETRTAVHTTLMTEIEAYRTENGLRLEVPVLLAIGRKPERG